MINDLQRCFVCLCVSLLGFVLLPLSASSQDILSEIDTITISLPELSQNAEPLRMVLIPKGQFVMGSPDSGSVRHEDETPAHTVIISKDFYMGKTEITQAQWRAVMGGNPSRFPGDLNAPVDSVSWNDCREFIAKLNQLGQGTFRLPSEAEWEYACRAGTTSRFYWGDNFPGAAATANGNTLRPHPEKETKTVVWVTGSPESEINLCNGTDLDDPTDRELTVRWELGGMDLKDIHVYVKVDDEPKPVYLGRTADGAATRFRWRPGIHNVDERFREGPQNGHSYFFLVYGITQSSSKNVTGPHRSSGPVRYKAEKCVPPATNGFGLLNMSWNVWEWCQDGYDPEYYRHSPQRNPVNAGVTRFRVCRGGSKYNSARFMRSAARGKGSPDVGYHYIGLRIVRSSDE